MALPQNPLSDIMIHNTLKTQNDNLSAQTKVLHKLSDSIMDQRKEFAELRKDIRNSQREFFTGNQQGMASIQKYFEKYKSDNKTKSKDESASTGFFKSAVNKLFGPSKYQQKMMEEITRVRELTESTSLNINFLRQVNEEGPRKRERELLAKAIAEKLGVEIKDSQEGGGEKGGGGLLSGILDKVLMGGQLLISFLGTAVVPVLISIVGAVSAIGISIVGAIAGLAEALAVGSLGGLGGGGGGRGGRVGPGGRPIPGQLQIEGRGGPRDMGMLRQNGSGTYVPEGAVGGGIKGMLGKILGAGVSAAAVGSLLYGLYGSSDEDIEKLKAAEDKKEKVNVPSFAERFKDIKWFDNENTGEKGDRPRDAWDKLFNPEKFKWSQESLDKQTDGLADTAKKMNKSLETMLKDFTDFPKKMEQYAIDKLVDAKDFLVNEMNQLGEINFAEEGKPKQAVNLLPGLGDAVYDTLREAYKESEKVANQIAPNAQMFNQSITQNVTNGGAPVISPAQVTAEGIATLGLRGLVTRSARIR